MDSDIKISVIIPAYNSSKHIENSLKSVISQTEEVHEIIVIDDGSKDDTLQKIEKFKRDNNLDNLIFISQQNSGPSKARNRGIEVSSGNYIAFLDSDDQWLPEKIKIQSSTARKFPKAAIICTEMFHKNNEKEVIEINFASALWSNPFYTSTMMIRRDVLDEFKFDESQKYSEDFKLYLQICHKYLALKINRKLIEYNTTKSVRKNALSANLWAMEKGELSNFYYFFKQKKISLLQFLAVSSFSLLKFGKRFVLQ